MRWLLSLVVLLSWSVAKENNTLVGVAFSGPGLYGEVRVPGKEDLDSTSPGGPSTAFTVEALADLKLPPLYLPKVHDGFDIVYYLKDERGSIFKTVGATYYPFICGRGYLWANERWYYTARNADLLLRRTLSSIGVPLVCF